MFRVYLSIKCSMTYNKVLAVYSNCILHEGFYAQHYCHCVTVCGNLLAYTCPRASYRNRNVMLN